MEARKSRNRGNEKVKSGTQEAISGKNRNMKRKKMKNRNMKNRDGYLLLEILICIFLFTIFIFVVSFFLKRAAIMEKVKKNSQNSYENVYFIIDRIAADIKNRDRTVFRHNGADSDFHFDRNYFIFRKGGMFYKLEIENRNFYISDSIDGSSFGSRTIIGKYDDVKMEKIEGIIKINIILGEENAVKIINLR